MDAQSEQIIKEIQEKRQRLGENLTELENKVREATDWRTYYYKNPFLMIGVAAGAGLLLASWLIPSKR